MKIYIAAPYSSKDQMNLYAAKLREFGFEVTSSWLEEPHKPTTQMHELTHEEHRGYATQDVKDILSAHLMIFFTDPTKTLVRAGRHVEFGIVVGINALCGNMPIFVVGSEFENIFHHLDSVSHFDEWELALDAVCRYALKTGL